MCRSRIEFAAERNLLDAMCLGFHFIKLQNPKEEKVAFQYAWVFRKIFFRIALIV